ncbi:MAG TPA: ornithine cyclodeaminase family protein [Candidatus Thermoplasmatota archaeon]|nr:ornithine cyclodeaminase family protein [Candidatus Thermoplasmatota archaeon]
MERTTLLLSADDVARCLHLDEAIRAVEGAFRAYHRKEAAMPPKSYVDLPEHGGDVRSMPSRVGNSVAVKWVCSHPHNPERHGLPTVIGTLVLTDPATGWPLSIMDATVLTAFRTGAGAAVATQALARPDARSLGVVGAGTQAAYQVAAISHVRRLERVVVADLRAPAAEALAERVRRHAPGLAVSAASVEEAAGCDIVSTLTPSHRPVVKRDWVENGAHINALGADAAGKQELDPDILGDAVVVVDDWGQGTHSGEINVPLATGMLRPEHIRGTLGAILEKAIPGRTTAKEITVFDSTGLAIQDAAVARVVYERAQREGLGRPVDLVRASAQLPDVLAQMRTSP